MTPDSLLAGHLIDALVQGVNSEQTPHAAQLALTVYFQSMWTHGALQHSSSHPGECHVTAAGTACLRPKICQEHGKRMHLLTNSALNSVA